MKLMRKMSCAVMVVHHMGKVGDGKGAKRGGQRLRGSSALHGATDSALYLATEGEGESRNRPDPHPRVVRAVGGQCCLVLFRNPVVACDPRADRTTAFRNQKTPRGRLRNRRGRPFSVLVGCPAGLFRA